MAQKYALRIPLQETFAAGTGVLKSEPVPADKIYCIQQVAWETSYAISLGNKRVRLYINGHGWKHYLSEQKQPSANTLYTYSYPLWLVPGEMLALEFEESGAEATFKMWLAGYWNKLAEGIVT